MTRIVPVGLALLLSAACGSSAPTSPSAVPLGQSLVPGAVLEQAGTCTVDVGATTHPLPAVHELEHWLGQAIAASQGMNCGLVRSLDAKMDALAKALDSDPPHFDAACGVSGALVNELEALVGRGALATPSFPPPFPGGPTNVLAAAQALNGRWCAAARGELEGPRS